MITQLQFDNDLAARNFQNPDQIVDFICEKLAHGADGSRIIVPVQIRRDLKADLTVTSEQEFAELLNNNGLMKIFQGVRGELAKMGTKTEFLETHKDTILEFYDEDIIDNRILNLIWAHLQSMRCPHLCPWCGMPCCGIQECNDKYIQGEVPCEGEVQTKHSCQFHRDETITGISSICEPDGQLPNLGDCSYLIRQNQERVDWDPEAREFVHVPYNHFKTTWRIRSEEQRETNRGLFWK